MISALDNKSPSSFSISDISTKIKPIVKGVLIGTATIVSVVALSALTTLAIASLGIYPLGVSIAAGVLTGVAIAITIAISRVVYKRLNMDPVNTKNFKDSLESAKKTATIIGNLERKKQELILESKLKFYQELDSYSKFGLGNLAKLKSKMQLESLNLKNEFDKLQKEQFVSLEKDLVRLTDLHNQALDARKAAECKSNPTQIAALKAHEELMQAKIVECNSLISQLGLSVNEFTTTKSAVNDFAAVVEKKLSLLEKKLKYQNKPLDGSKKLEMIDKLLAAAPSLESMEQSSKYIQDSLKKPAVYLVDHQHAKVLNLARSELKWGESHLNVALTMPANWTEVRTAMIKLSSAGRMHVAVTVNTPLNISAEGGMPSGLRAHKKFQDRATNLIKTTSYLKNSKGVYSERVSFRGGQFPTRGAAREALVQIIKNLPEGQKLEKMHVNALLTPTAFTKVIRDKGLIEAHKANILGAIDELMMDKTQDHASLQKLKNDISISNLGVNEGAVGELKLKGLPLPFKFGWHTSIGMYTNEACQKLNKSLNNWIDGIDRNSPAASQLDLLGAVLEVGQELEAVWANNDYANSNVGNNQFKMPALMKTMDSLIDVVTYTNCMSGKDRTGEVESSAQGYIDEINMNIADQKRLLTITFDDIYKTLSPFQRMKWSKHRKTLTAACFHVNDLKRLQQDLIAGGILKFDGAVDTAVKEKIGNVKTGLGGTNGLLEEKRNIPQGAMYYGIYGIPTNTPKMEILKNTRKHFPAVATSSMYGNSALDFFNLTAQELTLIENRHREAINRKLSIMSGSLQITQVNTGKPGFKVEGGESLARFSSGFDRDYVLHQLLSLKTTKKDVREEIYKLAGLHDLAMSMAVKLSLEVQKIAEDKNLNDSQKIKLWTAVLKEIEVEKMESMTPKAIVKA